MPASRARVGVIFFTVLIDLIGFGIVLPILPSYAQRFGAVGMGFSLGPAIAGFSDYYLGPAAPGLIAVGLSLANFVSAYFILPESLAPEHRVRRPLFDLGHIGEAVSRPRLRPLMAVWALTPFAFAGYTVVLPLYAAASLG